MLIIKKKNKRQNHHMRKKITKRNISLLEVILLCFPQKKNQFTIGGQNKKLLSISENNGTEKYMGMNFVRLRNFDK